MRSSVLLSIESPVVVLDGNVILGVDFDFSTIARGNKMLKSIAGVVSISYGVAPEPTLIISDTEISYVKIKNTMASNQGFTQKVSSATVATKIQSVSFPLNVERTGTDIYLGKNEVFVVVPVLQIANMFAQENVDLGTPELVQCELTFEFE